MAYNNGFPVSYGQMYAPIQAPQIPVPQIQSPSNNGLTWVQGEAGAKSFMVGANTTVPLWDSENPVIYLKSADASGMPSMKILDYTIREQTQNIAPKAPLVNSNAEYVTKDEMEAFKAEISKKIDTMTKEITGA